MMEKSKRLIKLVDDLILELFCITPEELEFDLWEFDEDSIMEEEQC